MKPHIILLDILMPEMSGYEVMELLQSNEEYKNIPVIFLTSMTDSETEARGFELGAVDFITKPFSAPVLLNRLKLHMDVSQLIQSRTMELEESHAKLESAHKNLIHILADMVEKRDEGTGGHIDRTTAYIKILIEEMISSGVYADELKDWDVDTVSTCAILHDVGKIGVSDLILNKPDKLTDDEFLKMQNHAVNGARIINDVIQRNGEDVFLKNALLFAEYHHESWDGSGYPHGLREMDIPIQGRLMAVADVYDALVSSRPYKPAFSHERAVEIIMNDAGKKFDPKITTVFFSICDKFNEIKNKINNK